VDVEGLEDKVLAGNDWSEFRPWIVLVEATLPMSQVENYDQWEHILLSADYQFVYADGLNRFYVSKEHSELVQSFKYPPNVFDDFILASQVQAEAKASEAEAKASEAEAKASEAEAKANEAEQSKSQWQLLVAQNQQSLIEFQLISTKLEQKAQELQEVIVSEQQKAERLNEVLAETEAKLTLAEAEIDSLRHHSHHWWVEAEEKSKQLNLLNETTNSLKEKIVELNASSHHWWQTADSLSKELEQFRSLYESVVNSHSWRITYPLRLLGKFTRWLVYGSYHWLTFSPNSRPRRLLKQWLISAKQKINQKPTLKKRLIRILSVFPRLKARLKRVSYVGLPNSALISSHIESSSVPTTQQAYLDLSQRAKKIYAQLKQAIEN
jgi:chemotaxis protein histidine kinase CheA